MGELWRKSIRSPDEDRLDHLYLYKARFEEGSMVAKLFEQCFVKRDKDFGAPPYSRKEDQTFQFSHREFAEAFCDKWSSRAVESFLREQVKDDSDGTEIALRSLGIADDYYRSGFVLHLEEGRHTFWRVYFPGMNSKKITRMVPKRFWSSTIHPRRIAGFSPLLRFTKTCSINTDAKPNSIRGRERRLMMERLERSERLPYYVDNLRLHHAHDFHHPPIIFDRSLYLHAPYVRDTVFSALEATYPRLNGQIPLNLDSLREYEKEEVRLDDGTRITRGQSGKTLNR